MKGGKKKYGWGEYDPQTRQRNYPLHTAQWDVLSSTARFTFAFAGTGGGKTVLIPLWLVRRVKADLDAAKIKGRDLTVDPLKYLIVVPSYPMLRRTGLLDQLNAVFAGTGLRGKWNKSEYTYTLGCGGTIFVCSAEYPESIEGGQYDALALDEVAKISYVAWRNAKARVGQKTAPVLGVSTPDINNWCHSEIFLRWKAGDHDYFVRQWSSLDNPTYSRETVENARATMSKAEFARRYEGEFARLEGLVYETFADAIVVNDGRVPDEMPSPVVRVACGLDWGWNDPLCCLVGAECQDGRVYVVEELYGSRIPIDELVTKLKAIRSRWALDADEYDVIDGGRFAGFFCDHSRPELVHLLRKHGLNARTKKVPLIETGISLVDARLRTGFLSVYDCCGHLIDEASHYQRRADRDGQYGEKPVGKRDHACDALRYLVSGLDFGRTLNFATARQEAEGDGVISQREAKLKRLGLSVGGEELGESEVGETARVKRWAELVAGDDIWSPC